MSAQSYDMVDVVLEGLDVRCCTTRATAKYIWECVSEPHGGGAHYFVRKV